MTHTQIPNNKDTWNLICWSLKRLLLHFASIVFLLWTIDPKFRLIKFLKWLWNANRFTLKKRFFDLKQLRPDVSSFSGNDPARFRASTGTRRFSGSTSRIKITQSGNFDKYWKSTKIIFDSVSTYTGRIKKIHYL